MARTSPAETGEGKEYPFFTRVDPWHNVLAGRDYRPAEGKGREVLDKEKKKEIVKQLQTDLQSGNHLILAEYRGLTVEELSSFRSQVRGADGVVKVTKNTLIRRAVEGTDKDVLKDLLTGPNALVYTNADPVPLVKVVAGTSKKMEAVRIKGGVVEGRSVTPDEIMRIAALPSREELLGKMLGSMSSPLQGLMNVCQGVTKNLLYALEAIRQAKEAGA